MAKKMAKTVLEQIIEQYQSAANSQNPADFLIVTRIHSSNWQKHSDSKYTREDSKGFKYDIFHANYPGNPKTSKDPADLNLLSLSLVSMGFETHAFAYRNKQYIRISAAGAKPAS
jgi:hypothetical protein